MLQAQCAWRRDIVALQQTYLVQRQLWARQALHHQAHQSGDRERQRQQQPLAADLAQHDLQQLAEAVGARAGQLIGLARGLGQRQRVGDGRGNVADIDRLELGAAAADQRQGRRQHRHLGEAIEEAVLRSDDDRRAQDRRMGKGAQHALLAFRLGAGISGFGAGIGADGGDLHEFPRTGARGGRGDAGGTLRLDRLEALPPAFLENGDQVDHRIGAGHGAIDRILVADVGGDRRHLADHAGGFQEQGLVRAAHRDPHLPALLSQARNQMTTYETGTAEHRDQGLRHVRPPAASPISGSGCARGEGL
eukprot:Opistho-1_new@96248